MRDADWRDLFDGSSLDGWNATGDGDNWTVEDGAIACRGTGGGYLYTEERFEDFDLDLSFRHEEDVNSGVFVRWSDLERPVQTGLEVQILDTHGVEDPGKHDCGALYDLAAPEADAARPAGKWNDLRVTCDGPEIAITLNGERVVDVDIDEWDTPGENPDGTENKFENAWAEMPREGHVGLQDHGGRIWFREVRVRER